MAISLSATVTGSAQAGFSSPTYGTAVDTPPSVNSKQWYVTTIGGTQTNVVESGIAKPFTITVFKPAVFKPVIRNADGIATRASGFDVWRVIVRKGVDTNSEVDWTENAVIDCAIKIPVGAPDNNASNLRAMMSFFIGSLTDVSSSLGTAVVTGAW